MKTTKTAYHTTNCGRCGGLGVIPDFHHIQGGICFSCNGTGKSNPIAVEIEMTNDEIIKQLEVFGFDVVDTSQNSSDDFLSMFAEITPPDVYAGARALLATL